MNDPLRLPIYIGFTGSVYDQAGNRLGSAGAGKDTAAQMLVRAIKSICPAAHVESYAFAEDVKYACLLIDPWITNGDTEPARRLSEIVDETGWDNAKRRYPEVRRLLQAVGTDAGWQLHEDPGLWVRSLTRTVARSNKALQQAGPTQLLALITDVRFSNEAAFITENDGLLIDVVRVLDPQQAEKYLSDNPHSGAASETELVASDYTLNNNGSLEQLRSTVHHFLRHNRRAREILSVLKRNTLDELKRG